MNRPRINLRIPKSKSRKTPPPQSCKPICHISQNTIITPSKVDKPDYTQSEIVKTRSLNKTNLSNLLDEIKEYNRKVIPDNDAALALNSLPHTKSHETHINAVLDDYVNCLLCYKDNKWTELLRPVSFDGPSFTTAPFILVEIGGEKNPTKTQLANLSLIDWMAASQKKCFKPIKQKGKKLKQGGFPYYQPSTQNQRLRTFFGTASRLFTWQYDICDFNFNCGLGGFLKDLYAKREKEFGKVITKYFLFHVIYLTNFLLTVFLFYL